MTRGVKIRIATFLVLSAVGIVYIAGSYLGFVDRILGRGITVTATLPDSGGLFEGSEVTYRGVKVGKVSAMRPTREGVEVDLALQDGTELPVDAPMYVHNLSAVGEQYLDFEPTSTDGPYAEEGDVLKGDVKSMPVSEAELLVQLDQFVGSVDKRNLRVVIRELGTMFEDTAVPLQKLLDNGSRFIDEAAAHSDETIALLENGLVVLDAQQDQGENIRSFSRDLRLLTDTLRTSDHDLRTVLQETPGSAREIERMMLDLEPTLPVLLGNAVSINQVMVTHLAGFEQLLVTFPRTIAGGFTGTTPDGYGHVNLQYDSDVPPCTKGYKPPDRWRRGNQLSDGPIFPAQCKSGPPSVMRGPKHSPGWGDDSSNSRAYRSSYYDPRTGVVSGAVDRNGNPVRIRDQGNLSIFGGDSWKWLLMSPVVSQ